MGPSAMGLYFRALYCLSQMAQTPNIPPSVSWDQFEANENYPISAIKFKIGYSYLRCAHWKILLYFSVKDIRGDWGVNESCRARIFKRLWSSGIDSKEWITASLSILAGRYDNPIPTRFLASIDCLKIPAQTCMYCTALYLKSVLCIPRNETARPGSQFQHSWICERFIY
jgi:hypothetical protein